jgi:peroxiredoxin family protein
MTTGGAQMSEADSKKASIVVFSGDMDKVMAAFIIATTTAAMGMETSIFFTFWGLKAIQKGNPTGEGLFGKMLSLMSQGGIDRIGPSRLNFGGMGRWMFKKMMKDKNVTSLPELRQTAIDLGVKLLGCQMSMDVMEITRDDLIDEVSDVVGAATYVLEAQQADITLFI